ncbi:MAG TPA: pyridoxal phosphate-dependent aminotransferase [Acidimicrobiales bacterium]|nr:pyridoxal phosphate-dependent aminotransferase [Acidimicrobiales bacterium]
MSAPLHPGLAPTRRAPYLTSRLQGLGTTIFAEMSALAGRTGSVNLGQGFPDADGPPEVLEAAVAAIRTGHNQYPPGPGTAELRQAIAEHQKRFYGLDVDPDTEVLVTAGATEAVAATILALCEPGDEVVTFEPFYDSYAAAIAFAAAQRRVVPLEAPTWALDPERLAATITARTRLLLLNDPNNPTGKVFTEAELDAIAEICVRADLLAVTDEVYEHLLFDGAVHHPLATRPGMAERTVTISSAGKTFSVTGWKIGWACGPAPLVAAVRTAKQFLTFVNGAPFQPAIAAGLRLPDAYFADAAASLAARRDRLCDGLAALGLEVLRPAAGYFAMVDIRSVGERDGVAFCRRLPERAGVVGIPASAFYDDTDAGRPLVRLAYCKQPEVLDEALRRLGRLTSDRPRP